MFSIKTFEQLTTRMIEWFKGNTSQITDFSIGSKARTMIEAVAMVVEELYYFVWEAIKVRLEESIYLAFDFPLRPARRATGYATFSRTTPAGQDYLIPVGTMIATEATDYNPEIQFETTTSVTLLTGETSVTIPIQARREGKLGNVAAGKIIIFFSKPSGVEAVTNQLALVDGRDLETRDERKQRFREYIASRWRATKQALQYGAMEVPGVTAAKAIETPKTYALIWDTVTYFDVTSPANDPYEVSVDLIPAAETVGSCLYLGAISKFNFLYVNMTRVGVGSAGRWEYWTGTEWKAIPDVSDGTNGLTQNGVVKFVPPSDWKDGKTYNVWAFWVRFYITAAEYTTTPQIGHIFMSPPPGIVELYVHDANAEASSELISNVVTAIEAYRAAEVTVNVKAPTKILLAPTCEIKVAKGDKAEVQERVKTMITDYLNAFKMGENFLVNKLETRLLNLDGGTALDTAKITNLTDLLVSPGEIIRPDTANVQVVVIN